LCCHNRGLRVTQRLRNPRARGLHGALCHREGQKGKRGHEGEREREMTREETHTHAHIGRGGRRRGRKAKRGLHSLLRNPLLLGVVFHAIIPALRRLKQEDGVQDQPGYIMRPCLNKTKQIKSKPKKRNPIPK
jgi:hypothetical protein